jgi:hypothetical protein
MQITAVLGSNPGSTTGGQPASDPMPQSLTFEGSGFVQGMGVRWEGPAAGAAYPPQLQLASDTECYAVITLPNPGTYLFWMVTQDGPASPKFAVLVA